MIYKNDTFVYDSDSGVLIWNRNVGRKIVKGRECSGKLDSTGYKKVYLNGTKYKQHRIAWFLAYGIWPIDEIDHINGNRSDNRLCNLREVNHIDNCRNRRLQSNSKTGIHGVYWYKAYKKWRAHIGINGTKRCLGYFDCFFEACCVRKSTEAKEGFHENHGH